MAQESTTNNEPKKSFNYYVINNGVVADVDCNNFNQVTV